MRCQLELSSWGESVDVQAPPAADVVAVPQGGMSGFGSVYKKHYLVETEEIQWRKLELVGKIAQRAWGP